MAAPPRECPICCNAYTRAVRRRVECGYCHAECCTACLQQYLLLHTDAHCMSCKRVMDGEFLAMHLPRTWLLGAYKSHREKVLLDREMALLPASQDMLDIYREAQAAQLDIRGLERERQQLQLRMRELGVEIATKRARVDTMQRSGYTQRPAGAAARPSERRLFIRACPVDGCRGFLSTAWRCGTCETWVCKDCGEPKLNGQRDDEHVCDADIAASHAMLQRDTKPCPQCAAMIFKVDGCDQMWCAGRRS